MEYPEIGKEIWMKERARELELRHEVRDVGRSQTKGLVSVEHSTDFLTNVISIY
jgi:hypothetical protein